MSVLEIKSRGEPAIAIHPNHVVSIEKTKSGSSIATLRGHYIVEVDYDSLLASWKESLRNLSRANPLT